MKVIQITDTHLFADDELQMYGAKCNLNFNEVIKKIISEDLHNADMIFLTGDLSQDETKASYQKIADTISPLNIPVYWIPGNHDNNECLESVFLKTPHFNREISLELSDWYFIFLNTKIAGRDDGQLSQSELITLKNEIHKAPSHKNIAIVMHHHPAPVGTPLIDKYILKNNLDFWEIVTASSVVMIMCGHVHGDYQFKHNNIMIESAPATCLQWLKGTTDLISDNRIGYKVYYFDRDGYRSIAKLWY